MTTEVSKESEEVVLTLEDECNAESGDDEHQAKNGDDQPKLKSARMQTEEGATPQSFVAQHYNAVPNAGLAARKLSQIFHMRNLNNWTKSMLISEFIENVNNEFCVDGKKPQISVLDLCCGKGGDLLKWRVGRISKLLCTDIADVSLEQCESRYNDMIKQNRNQNVFDAQFFVADSSNADLSKIYPADTKFHLTSCQFALHYSFQSYNQAIQMLRNACQDLLPGGYFIATIPNSIKIVNLVRSTEENEFKNRVLRIKFENEEYLTNPPLFGAKYDFNLDEVVNCPEYLVHFPLLVKLLSEFDMELVFCKSFPQMFDEKRNDEKNGRHLLGKLSCLEPFPPSNQVERCGPLSEYSPAEKKLEELNSIGEGIQENRAIGTVSEAEWQVFSLYNACAFRKKKT